MMSGIFVYTDDKENTEKSADWIQSITVVV